MRAKRSRLVLVVAIFTLGLLVTMLSGPWRLQIVSPGELSSVHLAIEGSNDEENCSSCHQAGSESLSGWLNIAMGESAQDHGEQCISCHFKDDEIAKEQSMLVHGVRTSVLTGRILSRVDAGESASIATEQDETAAPKSSIGLLGTTTGRLLLVDAIHGPVESVREQMPCATCHQEHRGSDHDLTFMSDAQCQVCHQNPFESFNEGHPKFTQVSRQSGGISFDHAKHEERFESGELDCGNCHIADSLGLMMEVRTFESACQGCHEQGSSDHHGDAIKKNPLFILQLPEIEFEDEVYWPTDHAYGEALTPMMAILLAGDDAALPLVRMIFDEDGAAGDLYEWLLETDDNDEPELRLELAAALKRLVADLADHTKDGALARSTRLAKAFGTDVDDIHVQNLANELASANFVMQSFRQRYLPQLSDDMAGVTVSADDDVQPDTQWVTSSSMGGWRIDSDEGSISYSPSTHADGLLRHWMDALKIHSTKTLTTKQRGDEDEVLRGKLRKQFYADLKNDFNTCTKCHTQENTSINWAAAGRAEGFSGYAKFNHSPHIAMLPQENNCVTCHILNSGAKKLAGISMPRGFLPHRNERCESCHEPGRANNSCLNCHQYHELRP
jgi:hypothetical protein